VCFFLNSVQYYTLTSLASSSESGHDDSNDDAAANTDQSVPGVRNFVQLHQRKTVRRPT